MFRDELTSQKYKKTALDPHTKRGAFMISCWSLKTMCEWWFSSWRLKPAQTEPSSLRPRLAGSHRVSHNSWMARSKKLMLESNARKFTAFHGCSASLLLPWCGFAGLSTSLWSAWPKCWKNNVFAYALKRFATHLLSLTWRNNYYWIYCKGFTACCWRELSKATNVEQATSQSEGSMKKFINLSSLLTAL